MTTENTDGEPLYDIRAKTWDKTCPCIEAMQTDPDCEWHGRIARGGCDMSIEYEKPFLVNVEGPDDIEEFDTMREAAERANAINADLVQTLSRGGESAPHLWAVPWRTSTYLARFRAAEG